MGFLAACPWQVFGQTRSQTCYHVGPLFIPWWWAAHYPARQRFMFCPALTLLAFIDPIKLRRFKIHKAFQVRTISAEYRARINWSLNIMLSLMVLAWLLFLVVGA